MTVSWITARTCWLYYSNLTNGSPNGMEKSWMEHFATCVAHALVPETITVTAEHMPNSWMMSDGFMWMGLPSAYS